MTIEEVRKRLEEIRAVARYDGEAHEKEDGIFVAVLEAIANGTCADPTACAREALKSRDIKFSRWSA
jgi:hypothetical protein